MYITVHIPPEQVVLAQVTIIGLKNIAILEITGGHSAAIPPSVSIVMATPIKVLLAVLTTIHSWGKQSIARHTTVFTFSSFAEVSRFKIWSRIFTLPQRFCRLVHQRFHHASNFFISSPDVLVGTIVVALLVAAVAVLHGRGVAAGSLVLTADQGVIALLGGV